MRTTVKGLKPAGMYPPTGDKGVTKAHWGKDKAREGRLPSHKPRVMLVLHIPLPIAFNCLPVGLLRLWQTMRKVSLKGLRTYGDMT